MNKLLKRLGCITPVLSRVQQVVVSSFLVTHQQTDWGSPQHGLDVLIETEAGPAMRGHSLFDFIGDHHGAPTVKRSSPNLKKRTKKTIATPLVDSPGGGDGVEWEPFGEPLGVGADRM